MPERNVQNIEKEIAALGFIQLLSQNPKFRRFLKKIRSRRLNIFYGNKR